MQWASTTKQTSRKERVGVRADTKGPVLAAKVLVNRASRLCNRHFAGKRAGFEQGFVVEVL